MLLRQRFRLIVGIRRIRIGGEFLMFRKSLLVLTTLLFGLAATVTGQTERDRVLLNPGSPQGCEQNIVSMEELVAVTLEQTKSGGVLIVIAYLGDGERVRELNRRRLFNVREFI